MLPDVFTFWLPHMWLQIQQTFLNIVSDRIRVWIMCFLLRFWNMCFLPRRLQDRLWCPSVSSGNRLSFYSRWCHNDCISSTSIAFHHCINHIQHMTHDHVILQIIVANVTWPTSTKLVKHGFTSQLLPVIHPHVRFEEDCGFPHPRSAPFLRSKQKHPEMWRWFWGYLVYLW